MSQSTFPDQIRPRPLYHALTVLRKFCRNNFNVHQCVFFTKERYIYTVQSTKFMKPIYIFILISYQLHPYLKYKKDYQFLAISNVHLYTNQVYDFKLCYNIFHLLCLKKTII